MVFNLVLVILLIGKSDRCDIQVPLYLPVSVGTLRVRDRVTLTVADRAYPSSMTAPPQILPATHRPPGFREVAKQTS